MRVILTAVFAALFALAFPWSFASAQWAAGDRQEDAAKPVAAKAISLSGKVSELKSEPCEITTGDSSLGKHLVIRTPKGKTVTIHLGPAAKVEPLIKDLSPGMEIRVEAFRTEETEKGAYVARTLSFGDRTVVLRDKTLRPVWADRGRNVKPPRKIAVTAAGPSLDADVDPQFGRCPYFVVIDLETGSFEALKNAPGVRQAGVQSARTIASKGATVLLTGNCGANALRALSAEGIEVISDCSGTVRKVMEQYKAGQLPTRKAENKHSSQPSTDTRPP